MLDTSYQRLKFEKAIAYLRDKLGIGSDRWDSLWDEIQDYVFSIAGVESALVLQAVQDKLVQVLEGRSPGIDTFKDFSNTFQQTMQTAGYGKQTPWRTRLVYTTNIRQAYNAGRYQQAIAEDHPNEYVQYWHGHPIVPRPAHKALHQRVFRKDDPILKIIAPSNGFGCSCRLLSVSDRDLKRENLKVAEPLTETITIKDRLTGKTMKVPAITVDGVKHPIAEPGFTTAPGVSQNREEVLRAALERLSPNLRSQAESTIKERYPDFSEIDFGDPDQPRDNRGRFAKKNGAGSLAKEWVDSKTKQLHKEQKDQFTKDPELAKTLILSGTNKTYEQILKEDGVEAAQNALDNHFQKVATRQAQKTTPTDDVLKEWDKATRRDRLKQAIADERQGILDNGSDLDKQELAAFERMRPKLVGKTTLADYKAKKAADLKKAIAEYEREVELDKAFKYEAVMERGDRLTKILQRLDAPLEPEYQALASQLKDQVMSKGMPGNEALAYSEDMVRKARAGQQMARFRKSLIGKYGISQKEASNIVKKINFDNIKESDRPALETLATDFFRLTGGRGSATLKRYDQQGDRASASQFFENVNIGDTLKPRTVFHEHGHHFEYSDPRIAEAAREWRDRRATGSERSLNDITGSIAYSQIETAMPGKYIDPYVGKIYPGGNTEVVSMGIENFHSDSGMIALWKVDPDHFKFIVGLLSAETKG